MPKPTLPLITLSFFTTPQKAAEIEGDLVEQAYQERKLWFAYQVALTALFLFRSALIRNFFAVALMSYATYEFCTKAYFRGIRPLRWYVEFELGVPSSYSLLLTYALVILVTFLAGWVLLRLLRNLGSQVLIGVITLLFLRLAVLQEGFTLVQLSFCVAVPMLAGAILANWINLLSNKGTGIMEL